MGWKDYGVSRVPTWPARIPSNHYAPTQRVLESSMVCPTGLNPLGWDPSLLVVEGLNLSTGHISDTGFFLFSFPSFD